MSAEVIIQSTTLPEGFCPSGSAAEQQRLDAYAAHMIGALPGSFTTLNFGSSTPEVDDRDKPWARTNDDGSFDKIYTFFNGVWSSPHPDFVGTIKLWEGDPSTIDTLDGGEAGVVSAQTGPMWEIVIQLAAKFPIGVGTLPSGTVLATGATGGLERVVLLIGNLARHFHQMFVDDQGNSNTGINPTSTTPVYREKVSSDDPTNYRMSKVRSDDASLPTVGPTQTVGNDDSHENLPPFYALTYIRKTSRLYYVV